MNNASTLTERIKQRNAKVGVIGLGYVGLPLSLEFTDAGFDVAGFDIDKQRVSRLLEGDSYVNDVDDTELIAGLNAGFEPTTDPGALFGADVFVIAVPTDFKDGTPSMDAVKAAAYTAAEQHSKEALVVVSSTVYPSATREVIEPILSEASDEQELHVAMVPERINPGGDQAFSEIPLVIGADTQPAQRAATALFKPVVSEIHGVDSTETAEFAKTLENTYRMVNIALVNELVTLAEATEVDLWQAIEAADTKPFGFQAFYPGPGVGGHCIPVDPKFLLWQANEHGTELPLVENADRINSTMPATVIERFETILAARGIDQADALVVALGASYKKNVGDVRNSPACRVIESLSSDVVVVDPHVNSDEIPTKVVPRVADIKTTLQHADGAILLVDHDALDIDEVVRTVPFVFDTRDAAPNTGTADVITLGDLSPSTYVKSTPSR